jgi:hypothetical protein
MFQKLNERKNFGAEQARHMASKTSDTTTLETAQR